VFVCVRARSLCVGCVCLVCVRVNTAFNSFKHFIANRQTEINIYLPVSVNIYRAVDMKLK
jgi:hypothetical protein